MVQKLQNRGYYYQTTNLNDGTTYNIRPSAFGAKELKVTTPEVVVTAPRKRTYSSAFDPTAAFEPVHGMLDLMGKAFGKATDATGTTKAAQTVMPWLMPSQYIGWMHTGNRPGTEGNTGFGESKQDQYLNEMFDLGTSPALMKGVGKGVKAVRKGVKKSGIKSDVSNTEIFDNKRNWLNDIDESSGPKRTFTPSEIKKMYLVQKRNAYKYFKSPEFKARALQAGFKEYEIPLLLEEIEDHLKKTKFDGTDYLKRGAVNSGTYRSGQLRNGSIDHYINNFKIKFHPNHSKTQLFANAWHELMHSIGGKTYFERDYPLLNRLKAYNDKLAARTYQSEEFFKQRSVEESLKRISDKKWLDDYNNPKSPKHEAYAKLLSDNTDMHDWLLKEIHLQPWEFRSRLSTVLQQLRNLGYDTSELINKPEKFSQWIKDLRAKNTNMSWDLNQLLAIYGEEGLNNAASKILTTTGAAYLGAKSFDNSK